MRELAINAIRTELGLNARFGEVALDLGGFPSFLTIRATGIALDHPQHGTFVQARELRIKPSLKALLFGQVDLDQIEIDQPSVHLIVRDGRIVNLPASRGQGPQGPVDIPLRRLVVSQAKLSIDAGPDASLALEKVDILVRVSRRKHIDLVVDGAGGSIRHATGVETFQRYRFDASLDPNEKLAVRELLVRTPHFRVALSNAETRLPFNGVYSGTVDVNIALERLRELPFGKDIPPMDGVVQGRVSVRGTPEGPVGQAKIKLNNVHLVVAVPNRAPLAYGFGETVDLSVDFDPKEVRIGEGRFQLIRNGGSFGARGKISLDPARGFPIDLRVDINDVHFAQLLEQLDVTPHTIVQWRITGKSHLTGTLSPLRIAGPLDTQTRDLFISLEPWHAREKRRIIGVERGDVQGRISIRPDGFRFEKMTGTTKSSKVHADILLGFDNQVSVEGTSSWVDLADVSPLLVTMPLAGKGKVSVSVKGTFQKPETSGSLAIDNFEFSGFRLGNVVSDWRLEYDSMAVLFPKVHGTKDSSSYVVDDLLLDFREDRFTTTGTMRTPHMRLSDLYSVIRYEEDERFTPYQATVSGDIGIHYTLGHPGDSEHGTIDATLALDVEDADIQGFAFSEGRIEGRWHWLDFTKGRDSGRLTLDHAFLRKGEGVITLSGVMDYGSKLQMTGVVDQISLRDVEGVGNRFPQLSGTLTASLDIGGTASIPRVDMDVGTTGLVWAGASLGDGRLRVRLTDRDDPWVQEARDWDAKTPPADQVCGRARAGLAQGRWKADPPVQTVEGPMPALDKPMAYLVCGDLANGRVKLDMAFGRTEVYPLRGSVDLVDFTLDDLLRPYRLDPNVRAKISAQFLARGGSLKEDDSIVGDLTVRDLRADIDRITVRNRGDLALLLKGRAGYEVVQATLEAAGSEVTVRGEGSTRGGLGLQVEGRFDLGVLATLSPLVQSAGGQLAVQASVRGSLDEPTFFGSALLQGAHVRVTGLEEPIEDLNGKVTFSANRLILEDLSGKALGGRLVASGSANLREGRLAQYVLDVRGEHMRLKPDHGIDVRFGGDTRLAWNRSQPLPHLTGSVLLEELRYTKDIQVAPTVGTLNRPQRAEVKPYDPAADHVAIDVKVETHRPMVIANNLLDADVKIDTTQRPFRIVGTDQRYGIVGDIAVPRGVVKLRNRKLTIREADVKFDDPTKVDPHFDLYAETDIRRASDPSSPSWKISLRANGNIDGFRLALASDPQMPEEDVLLLLTVGMTRAEVGRLQAGELGTYGIEALSAMTGVTDEVKRTLKIVDELGIQSIYSEATNRPEPHVSVAKRVNDRVRINASTGLTGAERDVRASAVVQVENNTTVEASYDNINRSGAPVGNVGVDLRWRLEFE